MHAPRSVTLMWQLLKILFLGAQGHFIQCVLNIAGLAMFIEDTEEDTVILPDRISCTKVLIEEVPSHKRSSSLLKYYLISLTKGGNNCEVQHYGKKFVATFSQRIGRHCYPFLVLVAIMLFVCRF